VPIFVSLNSISDQVEVMDEVS